MQIAILPVHSREYAGCSKNLLQSKGIRCSRKLHGVTILCSFFITFAPAKRAGKYKEQVSRSSLLIPGGKHSYWLISLSARQLEHKKTMYAFGFFSYV